MREFDRGGRGGRGGGRGGDRGGRGGRGGGRGGRGGVGARPNPKQELSHIDMPEFLLLKEKKNI